MAARRDRRGASHRDRRNRARAGGSAAIQSLCPGFRSRHASSVFMGEPVRASGARVRRDCTAFSAADTPVRSTHRAGRSDAGDSFHLPAAAPRICRALSESSGRAPGMSRLVLELHVQPGAKRTEVVGMHGERIKIRLAAPAQDGRANAALTAFLSEELNIPKRDVSIEAGLSSRQKRVIVDGVKGELPWKMPKNSK